MGTPISTRLKAERKKLGYSQTDFAALAGAGHASQFNYESGRNSPNATYLAAIANAGADVQYIVTGVRSSEMPPPKLPKDFDGTLFRLKEQLGVYTDKEVAQLLGMTKAAFHARKKRDSFPHEKLAALILKRPDLGLDLDYIVGAHASDGSDDGSCAGGRVMGTPISTRLKEERVRLGLKQYEAAEQCGVSRETWVKYEGNLTMPGGDVLMAIANAGADVQYIVTGVRSSEMPPPKLPKDFDGTLFRLKEQLGVYTDKAVAQLLGMTPAAFNARKSRGVFPDEKLTTLIAMRPDLGLDLDYIVGAHADDGREEGSCAGGRVTEAARLSSLSIKEAALIYHYRRARVDLRDAVFQLLLGECGGSL